MATRLNVLIEAVQALLDAGGCTVPHLQDALALTQHQECRRIVWLTDSGSVDPAVRTSGKLADNGRRITLAATRGEQVWVYCYAETREVCEQLLDNVIVGISQTLETVTWGGYQWYSQEDGEAAVIQRSECAKLKFTLPLPVPDEITPLPTTNYIRTVGDALTTVTGVDEQGTIENPTENETGIAWPAEPFPDNGEDPAP